MRIRPMHEYFDSEDDTELDKRRKQVVVTTNIVITLFGIVGLAGFWSNGFTFLTLGTVMLLLTSVLFLIKWFMTKQLSVNEIGICFMMWLFAIMVLDIYEASHSVMRLWPCAVVLLDIVLLCSLPQWVYVSILTTLSLFLCVDCAERHYRFGLYDITGSDKLLFFSCIDIVKEDASRSPCPEPLFDAIIITCIYLAILLIDFYCTKGFARGLEHEKQKLQKSILLVEKVVADLLDFDLEEAHSSIIAAEGTPLTEVLEKLLLNLNQYKPYLPVSLFDTPGKCLSEVSSSPSVGPPSGDSVCILFTDIKCSTEIWEASPDAMKIALKIHNKIIRKCIEIHRGFEVKTIGDSFMIAFETLRDGVEFALDVQDRVAETIWPSDLIPPSIFESENWSSISLQIGLHYGQVEMDFNPASGKPEYFGLTVNKAACLEAACNPGAVAIDSFFLDQINSNEWHVERRYEAHTSTDPNPVDMAFLYTVDPATRKSHTSSSVESVSIMDDIVPLTLHPSRQKIDSGSLIARSSATVCKVHILLDNLFLVDKDDASSIINTTLSKAINCIERSEGSIVSVIATTMTIGWNTVKQCVSHYEGALRFTSLMDSVFNISEQVAIGISSGSIQCGNVGSQDQRFVTVFGPCVSMCGLLCQASQDIGAFALCCNVPTSFPLLRPVGTWNNVMGDSGRITIYEIRLEKLKQSLSGKVQAESPGCQQQSEWGWCGYYREAFHSNDWETIDSNRDPNDTVLQRVSEMMRNDTSLRVVFD